MESSTGLDKASPFAFLRLPANRTGMRDDPNSLFHKKVSSLEVPTPQARQPVRCRVHRPITPPSPFNSPPLDLGEKIYYSAEAPAVAYTWTKPVHNDPMALGTPTHINKDLDLAFDKLRAIKARRSAISDKLFNKGDASWGIIEELPAILLEELKVEWDRINAGIEKIEALIACLEQTQKHDALSCDVCAALRRGVKEPPPPRADQEHQPETSHPED